MTFGVDIPADRPLPEDRFTAATDLCPHPEWWSSTDVDSTEREVAEMIHGLVRGLQPTDCLETGTGWGEVTEFVAAALHRNGHGHLYSLEQNSERVTYARTRCSAFRAHVTVVHADTLAWDPPAGTVFDFCWFDSFWPNRVPEFYRYQPFMRRGTIVGFHDTAPGHGAREGFPGSDIRSAVAELRRHIRFVHLPTARGLTIGEVIR